MLTDKIDGDGPTRDAGNDKGKERMQWVDNMDTETNSQEGKNLVGVGGVLTGVEKIMVLDGG